MLDDDCHGLWLLCFNHLSCSLSLAFPAALDPSTLSTSYARSVFFSCQSVKLEPLSWQPEVCLQLSRLTHHRSSCLFASARSERSRIRLRCCLSGPLPFVTQGDAFLSEFQPCLARRQRTKIWRVPYLLSPSIELFSDVSMLVYALVGTRKYAPSNEKYG